MTHDYRGSPRCWTVLTLNRQRLNASYEELHGCSGGALRAADEHCRAACCSRGRRAFCAGQDLGVRGRRRRSGHHRGLLQSADPRIRRLRKPVVRPSTAWRGAGPTSRWPVTSSGAARPSSFRPSQDWPGARLRRHLLSSAPDWRRPRPRAGPAGRGRCRRRPRKPGPDLEGGGRPSLLGDAEALRPARAGPTKASRGSRSANASSSNHLDAQLYLSAIFNASRAAPRLRGGLRAFVEKPPRLHGGRHDAGFLHGTERTTRDPSNRCRGSGRLVAAPRLRECPLNRQKCEAAGFILPIFGASRSPKFPSPSNRICATATHSACSRCAREAGARGMARPVPPQSHRGANTRADVDMWADVMARRCARPAPAPRHDGARRLRLRLFTGGLGAHYGAERLGLYRGAHVGGMTERQVQLLTTSSPTYHGSRQLYARHPGRVQQSGARAARDLAALRHLRR